MDFLNKEKEFEWISNFWEQDFQILKKFLLYKISSAMFFNLRLLLWVLSNTTDSQAFPMENCSTATISITIFYKYRISHTFLTKISL